VPQPFALLGGELRLGLQGTLPLLGLVCLAVAAFWLARKAYRDTEPELGGAQRTILSALRWTVLMLWVLLLAEPVLHRQETVERQPGVLLLVDDSASMRVPAPDGTERWDLAQQLRGDVFRALATRTEPLQIWFGEGARRVHRSARASSPQRPAATARSEGTDLAALLLSASQRHLDDHLVAIVLLSDGRSTVSRSPSLGSLEVPVYSIAVGDTAGPVDLRLDRLRYPSLAYRGEQIEILAELVAEAGQAGSTLAVLRGAEGTLDSLRLSWTAAGGRTPMRFVIDTDSLGLQQYELEIEAMDEEPLLANNRARIGIDVRKEKLRVVLVQEKPGWSFHFISRLTARDRRFDLRGIYRAEDGWRVAGNDSLWSWPPDAQQIAETDLWIAGSAQDLVTLVSQGAWLGDAVRAGAGVWVCMGEGVGHGLPAMSSPALAMLPASPAPRVRWMLGPHRATATALGRGHPVLALPRGQSELDGRIAELPPLDAVVGPLTPRDRAEELLRANSGRESQPLLLVMPEGAGQVALWTGAPLWSWSFWRLGSEDTEELFETIVGNLMAYLAEGGSRQRLRLSLPGSVLAQGQEARARAVALDRQMQPDDGLDVWLEWAPRDEANLEAEPTGRARMELDSQSAGGRQLELPSLPAGEYLFRVALEEGAERETSEWTALTIDPYSVEYRNPSVDIEGLRRISEQTGGRMLAADGLQGWAAKLPLPVRRATLGSRIDLWRSLWLFLPLLGVLTLEWSLRKRWGLI
jgi:hypothetical protein